MIVRQWKSLIRNILTLLSESYRHQAFFEHIYCIYFHQYQQGWQNQDFWSNWTNYELKFHLNQGLMFSFLCFSLVTDLIKIILLVTFIYKIQPKSSNFPLKSSICAWEYCYYSIKEMDLINLEELRSQVPSVFTIILKIRVIYYIL